MEEKEDIRALIHRFVHGQCTVQEQQSIRKILWEGKYEDIWKDLIEEDALNTLLQETPQETPFSTPLFARIENTIAQSKALSRTEARGPALALQPWLRWVAAIVLLISAGIFLWIGKEPEPATVTTAYQQHTTGIGQKKELVLQDGTEVWLNNTSSIRIPEHFSDTLREVYLQGEALFEVAKDASRPFVIHIDTLEVKVLGTSFNIQAYPDEEQIMISVVTGRVAVSYRDQQETDRYVLEPEQQLAYHKVTQVFTQQSVAVADALAWKDGVLVFKNKSLEEITRTLERQYGLTFEFTHDALRHKRITLKKKTDNMHSLLKILGYAAGVNYNYEADEQKVIFTEK